MKEGCRPVEYYLGIFDKYKKDDNLESWLDFPDIMWGLGFDIDAKEPYDIAKELGLKLKEPKSEREKKRNILYILEHAERQVVGDYLFAYWRYLTHWCYGYDQYEVNFVKRIITILETKY